VGPRNGVDVCEKSRLTPGFDHRTAQAVAIVKYNTKRINT